MNKSGKYWRVIRRVANKIDDVNMLFYHMESTTMTIDDKTRNWKETHILRMLDFSRAKSSAAESRI